MLLCILSAAIMMLGLVLMRMMLSRIFSHHLKDRLITLTTSPYRGFILGMVGAMLLQGSTPVTLLTVALVGSRALTFPHSIAILLGANVGTCSTIPLLLSLPQVTGDLCIYLVLLLAVCLSIRRIRPLIGAIAGLTMMIEGFSLLRAGSASLIGIGDLFTYLQASDTSPLIAILIGIVLTFILQSASSATLLLTTLAEEHLFSLHTICHIIYGNNIGSCLSAILASLAATREARMSALANLILNIGGVLLFLPLTSLLLTLATALAPTPADCLVVLHTVFNLVGSLLLLPFTKQYAALIERIYPLKRA